VHHGVLFLDELGEFAPNVLEALRQPIEDRVVRVSRAGVTNELPADFVLLACCNPCPCGLGDARCRCNDIQQARYRRRLSAPLLDRFDLRLRVGGPQASEVAGESSAVVRERVAAAVERQAHRYRHTTFHRNAHVPAGALGRFVALGDDARAELVAIGTERALSGRGLARVRRVARTIADLDGSVDINVGHVAIAAELRQDVV
jgi:magnesium chelatase family protein